MNPLDNTGKVVPLRLYPNQCHTIGHTTPYHRIVGMNPLSLMFQVRQYDLDKMKTAHTRMATHFLGYDGDGVIPCGAIHGGWCNTATTNTHSIPSHPKAKPDDKIPHNHHLIKHHPPSHPNPTQVWRARESGSANDPLPR